MKRKAKVWGYSRYPKENGSDGEEHFSRLSDTEKGADGIADRRFDGFETDDEKIDFISFV